MLVRNQRPLPCEGIETFAVDQTDTGPPDGLCFAVKDLIDVGSYLTGCGNPTWQDTEPPATANAVCVEQPG